MSGESFADLEKVAEQYAEAEAQRVFLTEFKKSKKAMLMQLFEVSDKKMSAAAQEREAYAHHEYVEVIEGLKVATEKALKLKFKMEVMRMRFETWRTKQATLRAEMNIR